VFIYTVIAAHILSIILFLVVGRYRLAIAPFFMIFAAAFFPAFYKTVRSGKLSSAGGAVAVAVVSFLYLNNPALSRNNVSFGSSYLFVGGYYYDNKDFDKAVEFFKKTVELEPGRAEGHTCSGSGFRPGEITRRP
jgi:tetratricopeptide (TPR) repeat protein